MSCFLVVKNNFKRSFNRRSTFIVNLILPIIVVILGILANNVSKPSFTIGVINSDKSVQITDALSHTDGITATKADKDTVKIDLITGKFSAVVSFSDSGYELFSVKDEKTNNELKKIIDIYKTNATPISIEKIIGTQMSISERTIAFIVLFLMVTATVTASIMIKDKNNGTLKRYKYSPQKQVNYVLGNLIYNCIVTFMQFFIAITFACILNINMGISYGNLIFIGILLSVTATAFGTLFSSIFKQEMYANLSATFTALILSLVGGTFINYDNMPTMLQKISVISPLRWFIDITKNIESGINYFGNIDQIIVLLVMILALLAASCLINKKQRNF